MSSSTQRSTEERLCLSIRFNFHTFDWKGKSMAQCAARISGSGAFSRAAISSHVKAPDTRPERSTWKALQKTPTSTLGRGF